MLHFSSVVCLGGFLTSEYMATVGFDQVEFSKRIVNYPFKTPVSAHACFDFLLTARKLPVCISFILLINLECFVLQTNKIKMNVELFKQRIKKKTKKHYRSSPVAARPFFFFIGASLWMDCACK